MRVVSWGTYDLGKPRVRILLRGLRENGVDLHECHEHVWEGVEDKSQIRGLGGKLRILFRVLFSYPRLIWLYLRAPKHDLVLVPYLGQLDVLIIWPLAKLRGVPIVFDAFISLYNTVVEDRTLVDRHHPLVRLLYYWEWLAARSADLVLLDTEAHTKYFSERYGLPLQRLGAVFVGAECDVFPRLPPSQPRGKDEPLTVLFYGQFIPLHGIDVIVKAAQRLGDQAQVHWLLIGKGQEEEKIRHMLKEHPVVNLEWKCWVPYEQLIDWIHRADLCLGIFSDSDKAGRVIPNKVFQVLSSGRPIVTQNSEAIRELFPEETPGVFLVAPADAVGLSEAILKFKAQRSRCNGEKLYGHTEQKISPMGVGRQFIQLVESRLFSE